MSTNIKKESYSIRHKYSLSNQMVPIDRIVDIIRDSGYKVCEHPNLADTFMYQGTLYMPSRKDASIRCAISHELGHLLMHKFNTGYIRPSSLEEMEQQADIFAAYLTMGPHFPLDCRRHSPQELQIIYGVTPEMLALRINLLKKTARLRGTAVFFTKNQDIVLGK